MINLEMVNEARAKMGLNPIEYLEVIPLDEGSIHYQKGSFDSSKVFGKTRPGRLIETGDDD